ncbi:hypothetical protein B0H98_101656 [Vreelandella songnenensis]|uniref:Uncharacterized protein n=2 Tax=Vreelandella songnenensis TaxID=1176243 RepID=A0A2T0V950_9GAMM|nr:hypothetical protein B0H98_101656 [Halomonas songnenensis]
MNQYESIKASHALYFQALWLLVTLILLGSSTLALSKDNATIMTPTYTRRRLLKTATFTGMGIALLPLCTLISAAGASSRSAKGQAEKSPRVMVDGWLLNASDR